MYVFAEKTYYKELNTGQSTVHQKNTMSMPVEKG